MTEHEIDHLAEQFKPVVIPELVPADRSNTPRTVSIFTMAINTNLVKPGQEPKTFEELAEPKWKGKVSMEIGDVDWFTAMHD